MLKITATKFASWFKRIGVAGAFRFRVLYWGYKITGWHIRHQEWDFVLNYLPKRHNNSQNIKILDCGCSRTLFLWELKARGYWTVGVDIEIPDERFKGKNITFIQKDLTKMAWDQMFHFVTCISVLEHIGNNGKGDRGEQQKALENMIRSLKIGGRLLLTIPTREFAYGHIWHGFTWTQLVNMLELIPIKVRAIESTERLGQMCVAIERCE